MYESAYDIAEAFGYLTRDEVTGLKELAKMLPENPVVVNIGAGTGTSAVAMMEERTDLHMITIDISEGGPLGGLENERNAIENHESLDTDGRYEQVLADSKEYAKDYAGEIDMVYIDGDHGYEGCKGDVEGWLPHIKDGGIIALDDYEFSKYDQAKQWPAVKMVVDELLKPNFEEILHMDSLIAFRVEVENGI